jgi:hypothetical protein
MRPESPRNSGRPRCGSGRGKTPIVAVAVAVADHVNGSDHVDDNDNVNVNDNVAASPRQPPTVRFRPPCFA